MGNKINYTLRNYDYSLKENHFKFMKIIEKWLAYVKIDGAEELSKLK